MTVLDELQAQKVEAEPIQNNRISYWYRGKRFTYIGRKRTFFIVDILTPGGNWSGRRRVAIRKEWDAIYEEHIQKYIEYLDNKNGS